MTRSYVNSEIEIRRFERLINESNKLIDYNNSCIKRIENTIRIYEQIINDLEANDQKTFKYFEDKGIII